MVEMPEAYKWSSFAERMALTTSEFLDENRAYQALGINTEKQRQSYEAFMNEGITTQEERFIGDSFKRNQLTGNNRFVAEIESKIGLRIERRARGRPRNDEK